MDFGIHMVDMLIWYFGKVHSVISSQSSMFSQDVEDSFRSKIRFSQGNEADFETSWSNPDYRKPYAKIEIQGERAKLTITDQTLGIITDNGIKQLTAPDLYTGSYVDIGGIGFSKQMQAFYESIRNRTESDLGISGACYVHKVIEAMYFSAKANKRVDL